MAIKRVCVYCASSRQCDAAYHDAATRLGRELARNQVTLVYGGGSVGSMGHLADAALAEGVRCLGVLPRFMYDLEWGHRGLSELLIVNDLRSLTISNSLNPRCPHSRSYMKRGSTPRQRTPSA